MSPATDRRQWVRLAPSPWTTCDLLIEEAFSFTALAVRDVAKGGIGLLVDVPVPVGRVVTVQMNNPATRVFVQQPAGVAHCTPAAGGGFFLGTALARPLADEDLLGLCAGAMPGERPVGVGGGT